jgi:hypothetical protein
MSRLTDIQTRLDALLQDAANSLDSKAKDAAIAEAIQKKYSKDVPLEVVSDVAADGTRDLPLPSAAAAVWEDGFSAVKQIEYPIAASPESYIDDNDWKMYRSPAGQKIRLSSSPKNLDYVRVTWTARHKADGTTIYAGDVDAVCCLAAAIAFQQLAAKYTQTGDSLIQADTVNYRTKGQEYIALAKEMYKRYADHVDLGTGDAGSAAPQKAALSIGDQDNTMGSGFDRITHDRYSR